MIYKLHKQAKMHSNGSGYITQNGHTMINEDIVKELNRVKQLEQKNAELRELVANLEDMKASFENSKRLYEASSKNNPQSAWIYRTCCEVLERFEKRAGG